MNDFAWLRPLLSDEEWALLEQCEAEFAAVKPVRNQLIDAAASMEELEKRFVPLDPGQSVEPDLQERVLVASVGFRPMPVILSALLLRPKRLYLLHSGESRLKAEQIRDDPFVQALGLDPVRDIVLRSISLSDAPANYDRLRAIVTENAGRGLVVDISGGVKVMGTSLAAAAFWLRIPVVYQYGEEVQGIVRPFSERLRLVKNPFEHFGSSEARGIEQLFRAGDYDAALALCRNMRESIGDVRTLGRLDILAELIEVYRDWDAFAHSALEDGLRRRLTGRLQQVVATMDRMDLRLADPAQIAANIAFLEKIEAGWRKGVGSMNDTYRLVDIFSSAHRRAAAGKYDDAVGRLYRCLEMSASIVLGAEAGMPDVKKPDFRSMEASLGGPDALRSEFREAAGYPLPQGKALGLKDQMTLLKLLRGSKRGQAIAGIYGGMDELMTKRNRSILAHGTVSISEQDWREFEHKARQIIDHVVDRGALRLLEQQAAHPAIQVEL